MSTKYKANLTQPVVNTRLWPEEVVVLDAAAKAAGMTRSEFVAKHVRQACGLSHPCVFRPHNTRRSAPNYDRKPLVLRKA